MIATGLSMASCNYLDVNTDTKDRMSLEEVFTDETYTEQWLAKDVYKRQLFGYTL